ncbi:MAG: tetraacyldisaccharide 4'-kinase [Rhodospirillales bacterium]|nr:tetraacyldisaccharide 4'-kinase [Rhodospirillales bacterium]
MPRAPGFWQRDGVVPHLLAPLSALVAAATARRVARPGWHAPVPVLCCGNVTVGGAGKTTLVLDLAARFRAGGVAVHVLLRGYGGRVRGPHRVLPDDPAAEVGDEALLLAAVAPTWVGGDRAASARAAVAAGAELLLLDDGLQNPTLAKDLSLLVIDGGTGFGNGRVLPAGPLREPVAAGAARCGAAVLIGEDRTGALRHLPPRLPVLRARLVQDAAVAGLRGRRVLAFAGIAHPDKFFTPLAAAGAELVATRAFPDHHSYDAAELDRLLAEADRLAALPVTTPKDAVRLPGPVRARVTVVGVGLAWEDPAARDALLAPLLQGGTPCSTGSASAT